jgi:hypothetical protein
MKAIYFIFCTSLVFFTACSKKDHPAETRSFYLAVTPWPADFTATAVDDAYTFINEHCDMVSHHFDEGIPYEEAYHHLPWPQQLRDDVAYRKLKTAPGKRILLSVSALNLTRHEKADYYSHADSVSDSIKNNWKQLPFNDPKIVAAYLGYIEYLIDELQPQYVNYGVESNDISWEPVAFNQYLDFLSQIFASLKTKYPQLPFFVSFMANEDPAALSRAAALLSYTDYITLSAYPYTAVGSSTTGGTDPKNLSADYFTRYIDLAPSKPWAFAETGYMAQDLVIPAYSLNKQGTSQWQRDYLDLICTLCNNRKAKFLVWFCAADYDAASARMKQMGLYQDLFGLWQDTGLKDENGTLRPAYQLWLQWMQKKMN